MAKASMTHRLTALTAALALSLPALALPAPAAGAKAPKAAKVGKAQKSAYAGAHGRKNH